MIEIARISPSALPEIAALEQELFHDPWSLKTLKDYFDTAHARGYVCRVQGEFAGYLTASLICGEGELLRIGVASRYRRQGLGKAMLERLKLDARNEGANVLFLEVRKSNTGAEALYEKSGFFRVGERKGYYQSPREDAFLYQLKL